MTHKQFFFVVGCQKSGTTWVESLLDHHPRVICKGEAHL
ncbi:MAG: sulfotransferase, partial [Candidatus Thorarchaeota archaeon]